MPLLAPLVRKQKGILVASVFQIVIGSAAVALGSLSLTRGCELSWIAQGIWVGSVIILTGIFGTIAYSKETNGWTDTYLWTSAISVLLSAALVTLETVAYTFTYLDCTVPTRPCDDTCLSYHQYLMASGEFLQAVSIGAVVLAAKTLRKPSDSVGVPYKKLITDV